MIRYYFVTTRSGKLLAKACVAEHENDSRLNCIGILRVSDPSLEEQSFNDVSCCYDKNQPDEISIIECIKEDMSILTEQNVDISGIEIKDEDGNVRW